MSDKFINQSDISCQISQYLVEIYNGKKIPHPMFVGDSVPCITFIRYVKRLIKYTNIWAQENDGPDSLGVHCAILAVEYLEKLNVELNDKSIHRYFMTAFLIGIKLLDDCAMSNLYWSEVSGCPIKQLNKLEIEMCIGLKWNIVVEPEKHDNSLKKFSSSVV